MCVIEPVQNAPQNKAVVLSFEPYHFANNLVLEARDKLKEIFAHWSDSEKSESVVREIIDQAPATLGVRIPAATVAMSPMP